MIDLFITVPSVQAIHAKQPHINRIIPDFGQKHSIIIKENWYISSGKKTTT